jgi:hypothetical protein
MLFMVGIMLYNIQTMTPMSALFGSLFEHIPSVRLPT